MLTTTVCGSFRRHLTAIYEAVNAFGDLGVSVLSPADPRVVDAIGGFVFVASDRGRSMKLVEDRHLAAIGASDFVWLVAPDGYVGPSAAMELGYALSCSVPVFCESPIADQTLRMYVRRAESMEQCVAFMSSRASAAARPAVGQLLLGPDAAGGRLVEKAQETLQKVSKMRSTMLRGHSAEEMDPIYAAVKRDLSQLLLPHD